MVYQLVCEGPCNPGIKASDAVIRSAKRTDEGRPFLSDTDIKTIRSFKHTEHALEGTGWARCATCGTDRRYGRQW